MPPKNHAPLPVSHASFDDLSAAGYDVQVINDHASVPQHEKASLGDLPINWKRTQPVLKPKVATLRDAMLFADGAALLSDGRYVYFDPIFTSQDLRRSQSHQLLCSIDPTTEGALVRPDIPSIEVSGSCFSARSTNPQNFGHFVHDMLSRIYYEDIGVISPGRDRVIAPRMPMPIQEAIFRKVFEKYEILQVPPHATLKVEKLLLLANLCSHEMFNPAAIAALAARMRRIIKHYIGKEKHKVCVSRRDGEQTRGRDFANVDAYETRMRERGFDIVKVSALDPEAQFKLWANTTNIVGVHGAGMMNMIMLQKNVNYTEIAGAGSSILGQRSPCPNWIYRCALSAGHNVRGIVSTIDLQGRPVIDIKRLESALMRNAT